MHLFIYIYLDRFTKFAKWKIYLLRRYQIADFIRKCFIFYIVIKLIILNIIQ
jgi:hypothetical protein